MEAWTDLYIELTQKVKDNIPEIQWIDLWHDQVAFLTEELPFPTPALFIALNVSNCDDKGLLIQNCETSITFYLFFETFSDTYDGSYNQAGAIDFLRTLTDIHKTLHGQSGTNHGILRRTGMKQEDSGGAGNLYSITFSTIVEDASAQSETINQDVNEVEVSKEPYTRPPVTDDEPLYQINT